MEYHHQPSRKPSCQPTPLPPSYLPLAYAHLATVLLAFVIGTYLMFARKGNPLHRLLGRGLYC